MRGLSDKPRLSAISFDISQGESVVIIGPNGSGKSTLLRLVSGELSPDSGEILFSGEKLNRLSRCQLARYIAIVTQHDMANLRLRVREYVSLGRLPYRGVTNSRQNHEISEQAMDETGVSHLADSLLGELSGGERQRAALARAFAQQPRLLLLDEPTNHLDPLAREQLLKVIRAKAITSVTVLHDLALAPYLADRIILLCAGEIICQGSADQVFDSARLPEVFGLRSFQLSHPEKGCPIRFFEAVC